MIEPLWKRALEARRRELVDASLSRGANGAHRAARQATGTMPLGTGRRVHAPLKIGDTSGPLTVVELLPRDFGRSDERVLVECMCGHRAPMMAHNFRLRANSKGCAGHRRGGPLEPTLYRCPDLKADGRPCGKVARYSGRCFSHRGQS